MIDTDQSRGKPTESYGAHNPVSAGSIPAPATDVDPRAAPQLSILPLRNLQFTLPMPLSVNEAWHYVAYLDESTPTHWPNSKRLKVRTVLTDEHRQYRTNVISLVRASMRESEQRGQPLLGRLHIYGTFFFANRRRTDVDNRIKPLQDALTHAQAYRDDSQIDVLGEFARVIQTGPERCVVLIREIAS